MPNLVVISTTAVPDYVRGSLTRWLTEPAPGLYVGSVSARVRDLLWEAVSAAIGDGAAVCVHPADSEQRYIPDSLSGASSTAFRHAPTVEEAETLDLPDGTPVIRQLRVIYSDSERPVEASVLIKGAHLYELLYRQTIETEPG